MVVDAIETTYVLLVSPEIATPPVGTVYQRYCPAAPPDAVNVTFPVPHRDAPVVVGAAGIVFMVATTSVRVLSQSPLLIAA